MKKYFFYWLALCVIIVVGCQKELSFETNNTPAKGSLQADVTGDCLPKSVNGVYEAGKTLVSDTNTITVSVNVVTTGNYVISTDTVNGYFFRATGIFTSPGVNTVKLRSNGTPFAAGTNNFVVTFDSTVCDIQIPVLPAGAGGPAAFTLVNGGTPANCATAVVNGTYSKDVAVSLTNSVDISVNVTSIGSYTITATGGGLTFSKTSVFTTTGVQVINIPASGTPTTTGANTITFAAPFAICNFTVNVTGPAVFTLVNGGTPPNCASAVVNGTYTKDVPVSGASVDVSVNVTTTGSYTLTATGGGLTFTKTATFASTGVQTVNLPATGTPTIAGANTITFDSPFASCSFSVTVSGPAAYTINCPGVSVNGTYQVGANLTAANTITIPITVTTAGSYSITASVNGMTFSGSGLLTLASISITLNGNTSTAPAGPAATYNLSVGSPACSIPIPVTGAAVIDWSFKIGATTYSGFSSTVPGEIVLDNTTNAPLTTLDYQGYNAANDDFYLFFGDLLGGINASETYNSSSTGTTNIAAFYFTDVASTIDLAADPTEAGVTMILTVTSHNTITKTVIGTFAGTAHDYVSSTTKTITNGTFKIVYP